MLSACCDVMRVVALVWVGLVAGSLVLAGPPAAGSLALLTDTQRPTVVRFRWPLDGSPAVVRRFEPPPEPWLPGHRGVDLAAPPGVPVRAAGAGVVHFAGPVAGRGVVSVDHPGGLRTTYEPVVPSVHSGQSVRAGDVLGVLAAGHAGCPAAACLHWGLRRGDTYLDPLSLLGLARVRLLPLDGRDGSGVALRRRCRPRRETGGGRPRGARTRPPGCRPAPTAAAGPVPPRP